LTTLIDLNRLHLSDNFGQAEQTLKTSLNAAQQAQDTPQVAQIMNDSALLSALEQDNDAQQRAEEALSIRQRVFGQNSEQVAESLNTIAFIHLTSKSYTAAAEQANAALVVEQTNPEKNALRIADSYTILAKAMLEQGDNSRGEQLAKAALDIHSQALGPSNPAVSRDLYTLGNFALLKGDTTRAKELFSTSLVNADDLQKPSDLLALSTLASIEGDMKKSKELFEQSIAICNSKFGKEHPVTLGTRALYVKVLWNHQRWLDSLQSRSDLPVTTSSIAALTPENQIFEKAIQTPQIQTYNWQNLALCLVFALLPLSLLFVMVYLRHNAFKVPAGHGFNEFVNSTRATNAASTPRSVDEATAPRNRANTSPSGRLALKNLRESELTRHK
jgi:hypothetical protein